MSKVQSDKAVVSRAIRYTKNPTGSAFADIKKYLLAKYPDMTIADAKNLKVYLKDAVKSGDILMVDGKYQINAKPKRQVKEGKVKSAPKASKRKDEVKKESKPKKDKDESKKESKSKKDKVKSAPKASKRKNESKKESKPKKAAGPKDAKIPKATNSETPVNESKIGGGDGPE